MNGPWGPKPPIDRTLFAFSSVKRQSSLASFCSSSSERHSSRKAFFCGATSHFAYHPDPRPPRARNAHGTTLHAIRIRFSFPAAAELGEREQFHPKVCVYRIFPSLSQREKKENRNGGGGCVAIALSLLPGKCDSFLLEGSRVRKGERGTTACSKRLQCGGGRNSRQAWGPSP